MSVGYRSVQWSATKRVYDLVLGVGVVLGIAAFAAVVAARDSRITAETLIIRGTAIAAFLLLTIILCIGPLARLDRRFLPLLFNRRHLGVTMFLLALVHAVFVLIQYHAFGDTNPLVSVFTAYRHDYDPFVGQTANISHFPFEPLGVVALVILFLMAATSHDFWLANLGASWWKRLHLLVLVAYGLIVLHVAYGVLQSENHPLYVVLLGVAVLLVYGLHVAAGWREGAADRVEVGPGEDGFVRACRVGDLAQGRGSSVWSGRERVALFRHEGRVYATSNVCRHQGGPIGEGRIVDGCITCPWHGWQYRPADGTSPPPFDERLETYRVRIHGGEIWVHPTPDPAGTEQPGAVVEADDARS